MFFSLGVYKNNSEMIKYYQDKLKLLIRDTYHDGMFTNI